MWMSSCSRTGAVLAERSIRELGNMAAHSDGSSYYRTLGVSVNASPEEIKRAYRRLAKESHPDRRPNVANATERFQALNEAYTVLSDPEARARYDAACTAPEISAKEPYQEIAPVTCAFCGAISAQPRYIIFGYVISLIVITWRRTIHGIFCPSCAPKKAFQASAISWVLGWWGVPWGPIWTIGALYRNLMAGTQPADVNGQILGRQSLYFWQKGNADLAAATVDQAFHFELGPLLRKRLSELRQALPATPTARLINRWKLLTGWGFWAQLAPVAAVIGLMSWYNQDSIILAVAQQKLAHVGEYRAQVYERPEPAAPILATVRPFHDFHVLAGWGEGGYRRVVTNYGVIGFVPKALVLPGDGLVDLTERCFPYGPVPLENGEILQQTRSGPDRIRVTNGQGLDAVVKLRDRLGRTTLSFYVAARTSVTIRSVPNGKFTVEFATGREFSPGCGYFLSDMAASRFVSPIRLRTWLEGEEQYTTIESITLNGVVGGNARAVHISEEIFDRN